MRILFQGDSITDGNRYKSKKTEWDKNHQIGHSYAYIVTGILSAAYPERGYEFMNRGVSGDRTDQLLARWQEDALALSPDVLSVLVGINDCMFQDRNGTLDPEAVAYERNYREILTLSRQQTPDLKIVLLEPFAHVAGQKNAVSPAAMRERMIRSEQRIVRQLADEFQAIFVPLQAVFDEAMTRREPSYWIWDGTHPTEAGHALIANQFLRYTRGIFGYEKDLLA